ncbi:phosphotransferase family protein [Catelliglobosispora koreensis]|uniref:phosphotransferase family protein n=1 Tax=Catelliglobosispora koreensis TaxID=129052 RepID=UPI000371BBC3|nr:aminoglycoside phosphotransferase family protein [Catelliglobosispora koreensis]
MPVPFAEAFDAESLLAAAAEEAGPWDLSQVIWHEGSDNVILETADGWMLRFPFDDESNFEQETQLLGLLNGRLLTPVPVVEWTGKKTRFAAYRKLQGAAFDPAQYQLVSEFQREALASSLARFLAALHDSLTPAETASLDIAVLDPKAELDLLVREMRWLPPAHRHRLDGLVGQFAAMWVAGEPDEPLVLLHNDFQPDNLVFAEPVGELTGVWDFGSVRLGPPAFDFRYFDNAPADLLERMAGHYQMLTTRPIDVEAVVVANRIEDLFDILQARRLDLLDTLLAQWSQPPS